MPKSIGKESGGLWKQPEVYKQGTTNQSSIEEEKETMR